MMPQRIQLRRTKGWRLPVGAVVVSRPSRWGNPYRAGMPLHVGPPWAGRDTVVRDAQHAVDLYALWFCGSAKRVEDVVPLLCGRDLACWCRVSDPCHADWLLKVANPGLTEERG